MYVNCCVRLFSDTINNRDIIKILAYVFEPVIFN